MGRAWLSHLLVGFFLVASLSASPITGHAQPTQVVTVEIDGEGFRTGDLFHLILRTQPSEGWALDSPDSIPGLRGLRQAGPVHRRIGEDGGEWEASYPLVALRPGFRPLPSLALRWRDSLSDEGDMKGFLVQLPLGGIHIQSVLPPPNQEITPAGLLFPPQQGEGGRIPLLAIWSLVASGLMGWGWALTRETRPRQTQEADPSRTLQESEPTESAKNGLIRVLRRPMRQSADQVALVEDAIPLLRSVLENSLARSLSGYTTPELMAVLATHEGGPGGRGLERALQTANQVRFREGMATPEEVLGFREDLLLWLRTTDTKGPGAHPGGQDV